MSQKVRNKPQASPRDYSEYIQFDKFKYCSSLDHLAPQTVIHTVYKVIKFITNSGLSKYISIRIRDFKTRLCRVCTSGAAAAYIPKHYSESEVKNESKQLAMYDTTIFNIQYWKVQYDCLSIELNNLLGLWDAMIICGIIRLSPCRVASHTGDQRFTVFSVSFPFYKYISQENILCQLHEEILALFWANLGNTTACRRTWKYCHTMVQWQV